MSREDLSDRNVNLSHEELTVSRRIQEALLRGVYNLVQISKPIVSPFEEETMPLSALYVFHYCFCTGSPEVVCVNILILT